MYEPGDACSSSKEITLFPSISVILEYIVGLTSELSLQNRDFSPEMQVSQ